MTTVQREVLQELQKYAATATTSKAMMEWIAKRLHEKLTRYNWVGFYLVDPDDPDTWLLARLPEALPRTLVFRSAMDCAEPRQRRGR